MTEKKIQADILWHLGRQPNIRLFRNNIGNAFQGAIKEINERRVVLQGYRRQQFGLPKGSSDLIGFIEEKNIARFIALEVKTQKGQATKEQKNFINMVNRFGGIAGIVRSVEEACALLKIKHSR